MGQADYYAPGQWNFRCQICGKKLKSAMALRTPPGSETGNLWVGPECFEIRNPQDFVRGIPDRQTPPWTTGDPPPIFLDNSGSPSVTNAQDYSMVLDAYFLGSTFLG